MLVVSLTLCRAGYVLLLKTVQCGVTNDIMANKLAVLSMLYSLTSKLRVADLGRGSSGVTRKMVDRHVVSNEADSSPEKASGLPHQGYTL